jgi:hypothetical protein
MDELYIPECPVDTDRPRIATAPRAKHTRDYRRAHTSHGKDCDCPKCWSKPSREARKRPVGSDYTPNLIVDVDTRDCASAFMQDGVVVVRFF